jgi:hypothetical protein
MRRLPTKQTLGLALAVLVSSLAPAGCKKSDTVLLVEVYAVEPDIQPPFQFNVTVIAGFEARAILVPETLNPASSITLPTSFTISMDRSHTGPISIRIDAYDEVRTTTAAGSTTQEHPVIGGQTVIAVGLSRVMGPNGPDGGADGGTSDDGAAGDGGDAQDAAGAAETGASDAPQDVPAAQDVADGMGLDTAAD